MMLAMKAKAKNINQVMLGKQDFKERSEDVRPGGEEIKFSGRN